MKNLVNNFKVKTMLCTLSIFVTSFLFTQFNSFVFLGEPEIPECIKEK
jgi:hypothetical protein